MKALLLALLTVAVYWPAMHADFVYDDAHFVVHNDAARHGVFHVETARPLTLATYWLNFHTTSTRPVYFHLTNLLIHLANGLLVYFLAQSVLLVPRGTALLASGLFLLHPLASEAVIYISGRSELLAMFFMLLSVLLFSRSMYVLTCLAFLCAVASKEIGLMTPILWWIVDRKERKPAWPIIGALIVGLGLSPLRAYIEVIRENANLSNCYAILSLLGRAVWPVGLNVDHDFVSQPWIYGLLAAYLIGLAVIVALLYREPIISMAALWIAALTLPHVFVEPQGYLTEHHFYAPMLGISLILATILQMKGPVYEQFRSDDRGSGRLSESSAGTDQYAHIHVSQGSAFDRC